MKISTFIIDDEPIALEKLKNYATRIPELEVSGIFNDGVEALKSISELKPDLIITDINMPDINGVDLIRELSYNPMVIFTTAYAEYAIEGFKVSAVDYILKPFGFDEFSNAINKARQRFLNDRLPVKPKDDSIFVKVNHKFIRISLDDIKYIKGYGEYLQIFLILRETPVVTLSSFASIKTQLPGNCIQVHRSYIINMKHAKEIDKNRIILEDATEIPIGNSFKQSLKDYLLSNSLGK